MGIEYRNIPPLKKLGRFRVHYLRTSGKGTLAEHHEKITYDVTVATPELAASHVRVMEMAKGNSVVIGKIKLIREERRGIRG